MLTFGMVIKAARRGRGKTLEAVARACRTQKGYLSGIENDKVGPPMPDVVGRLAKCLGVEEGRLLALRQLSDMPEGLTLERLRDMVNELLLDKDREERARRKLVEEARTSSSTEAV